MQVLLKTVLKPPSFPRVPPRPRKGGNLAHWTYQFCQLGAFQRGEGVGWSEAFAEKADTFPKTFSDKGPNF